MSSDGTRGLQRGPDMDLRRREGEVLPTGCPRVMIVVSDPEHARSKEGVVMVRTHLRGNVASGLIKVKWSKPALCQEAEIAPAREEISLRLFDAAVHRILRNAPEEESMALQIVQVLVHERVVGFLLAHEDDEGRRDERTGEVLPLEASGIGRNDPVTGLLIHEDHVKPRRMRVHAHLAVDNGAESRVVCLAPVVARIV